MDARLGDHVLTGEPATTAGMTPTNGAAKNLEWIIGTLKGAGHDSGPMEPVQKDKIKLPRDASN